MNTEQGAKRAVAALTVAAELEVIRLAQAMREAGFTPEQAKTVGMLVRVAFVDGAIWQVEQQLERAKERSP